MKSIANIKVVVLFTVSFLACRSDLPLEENSNTNDVRVLSSKEHVTTADTDVEELLADAMLNWWQGTHGHNPSNALSVAADALSCAWGNFGMEDLSSEPRSAYDNDPAYRYREVTEVPWEKMYAAISAVNEVLREIDLNDEVVGTDTPRAHAFGRFIQGLSYGFLALLFDQAFILDESLDLQAQVLEFSPHPVVMETGIQQLEACIVLSEANSFTMPSSWINGLTPNNVELAKLAHSYIARYLVQVARNATERANVEWPKVLAHLDGGISANFAPRGDGSLTRWTHSLQRFHNDRGVSWARLDYKLIGPSDKSGAYQDWLNSPLLQRTEFDMDTDDLRIWDGTLDSTGAQNPGIYVGNWGATPFPSSRGRYHWSKYGYYRYEAFFIEGGVGAMPAFLVEEIDLLRAEALLWTGGNLDEVAAIINNTRVNNGGYPPAIAADGVGTVQDERSPFPEASLWAKLKYEKGIELLQTGPGVVFFDRRGWDELVAGTPLHFPVPGKELKFLLLPNYTFGGGGPGSAQ